MNKPKNLIDYGAVAEQKAAAELLLRGFLLSWSTSDKVGYDLVADLDGKLFKLQVKGTFKAESGSDNKYKFTIKTNSGPYASHQVDFFILYVHPTETFYIVPFAFVTTKTLRAHALDAFKNAWHLIK